MTGSTFVGQAKTKEAYTLFFDGALPYVNKTLTNAPKTQITGDVYEIEDWQLEQIDALEGHPNWYRRELIPVVYADGREDQAWLYFNPEPQRFVIKTGDYGDVVRMFQKQANKTSTPV